MMEMDWKLVLTAFTATLFAEFGDKTQLAAVTLTASSNRPLSVFTGASVALIASMVINVWIGAPLAHLFPAAFLRHASAAIFIAIGGAMLLNWF
jgi:putative Ca2+/H+ antiporter (TMEM165/GDT1 family)